MTDTDSVSPDDDAALQAGSRIPTETPPAGRKDGMPTKEESEEAICVRLATGSGTAPEILRVLAREGAVTVRAAVAMNPSAPIDLNQALALDGDERVRALLARKLAGLMPGMERPGSESRARGSLASGSARHTGRAETLAAHETLAALAGDSAVQVRAAIADVVKQMPEAPRTLILRLARDSAVTVSEPVIRQSPILTAEDLLALLNTPPGQWAATSIAQRPNLTEAISDAIAASADSGAIRALLTNHSAAIREATLDTLIAHAPSHPSWHSPLVHRPALPAHAVRALSEIIAAELLQTLATRKDLEPGLATELRQRLAKLPAPPVAPSGNAIADQAMNEAYARRAEGRLTEMALHEAVQQGQTRRAAAMLAVAADVPLSVVDRATSLRTAKGLISLIWDAGFSMRIAGPLQAMLTRLPPNAILAPGPDGAFPLTTEEMHWQLDFLKRSGR